MKSIRHLIWRLSLNEKPKFLCESSEGVWNYLVYDYTCSRIWFLLQLKVDLPEYGARLYVRDSLFSDTSESCMYVDDRLQNTA